MLYNVYDARIACSYCTFVAPSSSWMKMTIFRRFRSRQGKKCSHETYHANKQQTNLLADEDDV